MGRFSSTKQYYMSFVDDYQPHLLQMPYDLIFSLHIHQKGFVKKALQENKCSIIRYHDKSKQGRKNEVAGVSILETPLEIHFVK